MAFITATKSKLEQKLVLKPQGIDVTKLAMTLEHWAGKATECSKFNGLFCRILEDKSVKSDDGVLVCEVAEGSKDCQDYLSNIF